MIAIKTRSTNLNMNTRQRLQWGRNSWIQVDRLRLLSCMRLLQVHQNYGHCPPHRRFSGQQVAYTNAMRITRTLPVRRGPLCVPSCGLLSLWRIDGHEDPQESARAFVELQIRRIEQM